MLVSEQYCESHCKKGKIWGIKQPAKNQYYSILHAFNVILKWVLHNITQYYIDIIILLNITCILGSIQINTTEYYIQYYSILHVKSYNTTQYYMRIG